MTCQAGVTTGIRRGADGDGMASFAAACDHCPLRAQCPNAASGRTIHVGRYERRVVSAGRRRISLRVQIRVGRSPDAATRWHPGGGPWAASA